jgi:hypothetical protein
MAATAGTDGLGNAYPAGISSSGGVVSQSVILLYNGTPAAGNLIASIADSAGADTFGNAYTVGFTSYTNSTQPDISISNGQVLIGTAATAFANAASLNGDATAGKLRLLTGSTTATPARVIKDMVPGADLQPTGSHTGPYVAMATQTGTGSVVDLYLTGSIISGSAPDIAETWHTPAFAANWATTSTLNGNSSFTGLQYRMMAENDVWLCGAALASGAGATIFTLPVGYRPTVTRAMVPCWIYNPTAGTVQAAWCQITTDGAVNLAVSLTGVTIAAGYQVYINGHFPLQNVA